ncbi:CheA signal transduction histidine kinase [Crinalium epipsammum PCC 9333]|uniref:histidine kinase n=1 Tax=Crinalium epipsammum PCC 9333 TaxID=1173022 RepID=K9W3L6_9CYAN|nr:chemotaxis protein CheA [Crinalium epipsammum]AFZ14347.1 CheA signal transduction histidine kinase [Crinalium epipsammum PCC 9333]
MSTDVNNESFFAEFADDYFAECEEHLEILRRDILALEDFVDRPQIERSLLEELFRSFHSLKGMSGMIGVREAEQLAHEMESYLRALREKQVTLNQAGMDALITGTKMLDQVITARRTQAQTPDITDIVAQINAVLPDSEPVEKSTNVTSASATKPLASLNLKPEEIAQLVAALHPGKKAWQFEFAPVSGLAERGINVSKIRERLQLLGQLIHAAPRITSTGGITFDFLLASDADESIFAEWKNDGVTYTHYSQESNIETVVKTHISKEEAIPPPPVVTPPPTVTAAPSNVVRVDLARLDELMQMVGELVISRARLEDHLNKLEANVPAKQLRTLRETNLALERQLRDLREGVMRVRLVPISEIFRRMQFVARDVARESNKKVTVELRGQETEIDKFVVERMMDPLLHLVRNAVSHGLEAESERVAQGKSPEGKLALRATTAGEIVVIEIEDDGRGVDLEGISSKARKLGLIDGDAIDINTALDIICSPGFSTREQADLTSGRGVGMAVVKNTVQELGGLLTLESKVRESTRFTIYLPLTLAIADALIVTVSKQTFAVPQSSVREVLEVHSSNITIFESNEIITYRGSVLPLLRLTSLFKLPESSNSRFYVIVVGTGLSAVGVAVDQIIAQQEIVVRPLTDPLVKVKGISGATELGDGRVVLIINTTELAISN